MPDHLPTDSSGNYRDDFSRMPGALFLTTGIGMIFLSFFFLRFSLPFAITTLVWGAIIVVLYLFFRHKAAQRTHEIRRLQQRLERQQGLLSRLLESGARTELELQDLEAYVNEIASEEEPREEPERKE